MVPFGGKKAEGRICSRGNRRADGEDIVDQKRGAGDDAEFGPEQAAGNDVPAASERELLDDARVSVRDDEDGECGSKGERDGEVMRVSQSLEGLVWSIGRGGQAVGTQSHPREKRGEGDAVEDAWILNVPRCSEKPAAKLKHLRVLEQRSGNHDAIQETTANARRGANPFERSFAQLRS